MFVPLRLGADPVRERSTDVLSMLEECHERIRTFSTLSMAVASADADFPQARVRDAAERVARYFRLAMPLHVADEDQSLAPRLLAGPVPPEVSAALEEMTSQHESIDRLLEELLPKWDALVACTAPYSTEQLQSLLPSTTALTNQLKTHLELEERVIFPFARKRLDAAGMEGLQREMRARR